MRRPDATRPAPAHTDPRWARPHPRHVHVDVDPRHPRPRYAPYLPWYTHWWVHPYYRWHHAVVVVDFGWGAVAWVDTWTPPPRAGWVWVPGRWVGPHWAPGHFVPVAPPPPHFVFVPGWWVGSVYVEGYWRRADRPGWRWVEGTYLEDGTYAWGYWEPVGRGPRGYVWEHGTWDGEVWVEGFWRPEFRAGFRWVSSAYGQDGIYRAGYWEPLEPVPGHVWVPGWFDGVRWIEGTWVTEAEAQLDPAGWTPPPAGDPGRGAPPPDVADEAELPVAIPVDAVGSRR